MSKNKTKLYETKPPKANKNIIKIDLSDIRSRNFIFLEARQKCRATVVESKKNKPPKYKHRIYEQD